METAKYGLLVSENTAAPCANRPSARKVDLGSSRQDCSRKMA
jgi:hypothetical protein